MVTLIRPLATGTTRPAVGLLGSKRGHADQLGADPAVDRGRADSRLQVVVSRSGRDFYRACPRQGCGGDHPAAVRVIVWSEVTEEYHGLA